MAKRFSETGKWSDEWFSNLKPIEKLVFLFLVDNCDNAGFIDVNARLNSFLIGITQDEYLGAIEGLNRGLLGAKSSGRLWIRNFLKNQKNFDLNPENNSHKQIIFLIQSNLDSGEFDIEDMKLGANEGLFSPIGRGKGNGIGKGQVKVEVEAGEKSKKFVPPSHYEVAEYFKEQGGKPEYAEIFAEKFIGHYTLNNWTYGKAKTKITNWKLAATTSWDLKTWKPKDNGTYKTPITGRVEPTRSEFGQL